MYKVEIGWRAKVLWSIGAFRMYRDGDGYGGVFRFYHPVSWLLLIILFPICAVIGEPVFGAIPFRIAKYWRDKKVEWVTPWTINRG